MYLKTIRPTIFKRRPLQSKQLEDSEKILISQGVKINIISTDAAEEGHVKVLIDNSSNDFKLPYAEGYFFREHVEVYADSYPANTDKPAEGRRGVQGFRLPGNQSLFYLDGQLFPGSNFTWAEATHNGTRMPETVAVVDNIIAIARDLQSIRDHYRRPVIVTSWYRPPDVNRRVGGVSNSMHITGAAVDFVVKGVSTREVANYLWTYWQGGLGDSSSFTHIDRADIVRGWARRRWRYSA